MLKRIPVSQARLGMYVNEFCAPWVDHPFWKGDFLIRSPSELQRILESDIEGLWIDIAKGVDVDPAQAEGPSKVRSPVAVVQVEMAEEIERAKVLCDSAKAAVKGMLEDARMGQVVEMGNAAGLVEEISDSVLRHPNALISLARLKTSDEYTYLHSVAVSALMIAVARTLGLDEATARQAGLAGLLHDVGKMSMPLDVLNKPGKLTDEEFEIMRGHPRAGEQILRAWQADEIAIDVCLHHHEKYDGNGYPDRLLGEQISLMSRIATVCDVYDAVTSDRPYKMGWDPAESVKRMAEWKGHFDPHIFQAFVKAVGIYPVGSLVRLESERLAVVMEQNPKSLLTPTVKVFYDARHKEPIRHEVIDLPRRKGYDRIISRESPEAWGFDNLSTLWT
ncbi:HD-GYP domain-containing protein [Pseudomonas asuensis]|uniref:Cyclic di-GMP phosphodiesterase n=1 Tax=Pseudomonas asuensis TaxID=1825787 RepID=A0ABQ2H0S5_9PSED|nr:HD-GYP domain-containing protein [Pseudomonas asuensis]GGM20889.1 cyclic di-GMP phosphodiesterase [Pseudomonas asuensis]